MKMAKQCLLFIISIVFGTSIFGQNKWINYTNNYFITDIVETDDGLWISSTGGLCFVNAETQEEIYFNRGNSDIPSNAVNDLLLHPDGTLWLTTSDGICTFTNGQFETADNRLRGIMRLTSENKVVVANYDHLFIQTDQFEFDTIPYPATVAEIGGVEINSEGHIYFNAVNFFAETYVAVYKEDAWEFIFSDFIYGSSITMDEQEKLWLVTSQGLQYLENEMWEMAIAMDTLDEFFIGNLSVDVDNNIIIEITTDCPSLLKWNGTEISTLNFDKGACEDCYFVSTSAKESNKYYASNIKQGFYSFNNMETDEFKNYTQSPLFRNAVLTSLHPENDIHYVVFPDKIQTLKNDVWGEISLPTGLANRINYAHLRSNVLWIADDEFLWFLDNGTWQKIIPPNNFTGDIKFMVIGKNNDVWIQTGTILARYKDDQWTTYHASQHDITSSIIKDMVVDPVNGDLWVSTFQGVRHFDGESWLRYDFPPVNHTFGLAVSPEGVFVRQAGMFLINDGEIDTLQMPPLGYYGPFESEMVYNYEKNQLYLSGSNHLAVYENNDWTVYTNENSGVYNGFSLDLNLDAKNNLWLAGSGGGLEIFNDSGIVLPIDQIQDNSLQVQISPNPVLNDVLYLEIPYRGEMKVSCYDLLGRKLDEVNVQVMPNEKTIYHLPLSEAGIYMLTIESENRKTTKKIVRLSN